MSPFHFPCHFFSNSNTKNRNQDEQQHPVPQKKTTETQQELIKEELQLKKVKVGRSELLSVSHTPSLSELPRANLPVPSHPERVVSAGVEQVHRPRGGSLLLVPGDGAEPGLAVHGHELLLLRQCVQPLPPGVSSQGPRQTVRHPGQEQGGEEEEAGQSSGSQETEEGPGLAAAEICAQVLLRGLHGVRGGLSPVEGVAGGELPGTEMFSANVANLL